MNGGTTIVSELSEQMTRKARSLLVSAQQLEDANAPEGTVAKLRERAECIDGAVVALNDVTSQHWQTRERATVEALEHLAEDVRELRAAIVRSAQ